MAYAATRPKERITSAIATVAVEALIIAALIAGVRPHVPRVAQETLKIFHIVPPAPPKPPPPPPEEQITPRTKEKEGAASPPNLRSKATEIVAPKPIIPPPTPPIPAAPKPDIGSQTSSGASDIPGPGNGSGGIGEGTGSGGSGSGPGGGGRGGTPPRHISGRLHNSDYPRWAIEAGIHGTITLIVTIEPNGRVSYCDIRRSSGSEELDDMTCRLIQQRYRYRPALDPEGHPVRSRELQNHSWVMDFEQRDEDRYR
jgi:protein TonB